MSKPAWMKTAESLLGVRETPGPANDARIMGWARKVTPFLGADYLADATPWCGLFTTYVMALSGFTPPKVGIRAKAWAAFGEACEPCEGAVLVFSREGGGHVGFYAGETAGKNGSYLVLGGNQGDAVTRAWIAKSRCIAVRWPKGAPRAAGPIILKKGGELSRNEA